MWRGGAVSFRRWLRGSMLSGGLGGRGAWGRGIKLMWMVAYHGGRAGGVWGVSFRRWTNAVGWVGGVGQGR